MLVEFPSVVDTVRCAVETQRGMIDGNADLPDARRIAFRIGVNLGDIIADGRDIYGDGVNIAARLEALAEPGGICISRVVRDQIRDKLLYPFEDMGEQTVKNIARPVRERNRYTLACAVLVSRRNDLSRPPQACWKCISNPAGRPERRAASAGSSVASQRLASNRQPLT